LSRFISDTALDHLRKVALEPDLSGTPYRVIEAIGRGGMGTVYLARDEELDREVAIKVVTSPEPADDSARRLRLEAKILAKLEHPGIVPVHDAGTLPDGRAFYVMKRVRGRRLDEVVEEGAGRNDLLRTFGRICEAVASAHAAGVVHRDLKPENVMVGPFGEVLVMDWGVAKIVAGGGNRAAEPAGAPAPSAGADTEHGTVLGTRGYMAPEQARGDAASAGPRSDVYALGGILYFLLARKPPPDRVVAGPFDSLAPRRLDRAIPRPLEAIVLKAMAEAPAARYAGAGALAEDVASFLDRRRVAAWPEGPATRALRLAARYQVPILLVAAYLVMRVLVLVFGGR